MMSSQSYGVFLTETVFCKLGLNHIYPIPAWIIPYSLIADGTVMAC